MQFLLLCKIKAYGKADSVLKWSNWRKQTSNLPEITLFITLYYTYSEIMAKLKQPRYSLRCTNFGFCGSDKLVYSAIDTYSQEPGMGIFTLRERKRETLLNYELLYGITAQQDASQKTILLQLSDKTHRMRPLHQMRSQLHHLVSDWYLTSYFLQITCVTQLFIGHYGNSNQQTDF